MNGIFVHNGDRPVAGGLEDNGTGYASGSLHWCGVRDFLLQLSVQPMNRPENESIKPDCKGLPDSDSR